MGVGEDGPGKGFQKAELASGAGSVRSTRTHPPRGLAELGSWEEACGGLYRTEGVQGMRTVLLELLTTP